MPIYDLNNIAFLGHDMENTFDVINSLYRVNFSRNSIDFYPKTFVHIDSHWASEESQNTFNKIVPIAKSLIKDMYAVLENIYKGQTGKFEKIEIEKEYKHLKEFRLLNNKFKHFNNEKVEIDLTALAYIQSDGSYIDVYFNFYYIDSSVGLRLSDFIEIYLTILEDKEIISINRKTTSDL
ncbi:MAG: hypothetical protein IPP60_08260 [Sphingobacteriales bacterium]|nr:hypothetical protein [Sphingobacteriales bacterium]